MEEHDDWPAQQFEEKRTHLRAVAYRTLGSIREADDALQEPVAHSDAPLSAGPGIALTTALDWSLRRSSPFRHKPVGIAGAWPAWTLGRGS
jgi:hypothetical protein